MLTKERLKAIQHSSNVCADIEGFDFDRYDSRDIEAIRGYWLQYGVIRFKQTRITDAQQVEFSRHFGEFVIHPKQLQEGGHPTHREILVISNAMTDGKPSGAMGNSEATWHTDTWFYEKPPVVIPRELFAAGTGCSLSRRKHFVSPSFRFLTLSTGALRRCLQLVGQTGDSADDEKDTTASSVEGMNFAQMSKGEFRGRLHLMIAMGSMDRRNTGLWEGDT